MNLPPVTPTGRLDTCPQSSPTGTSVGADAPAPADGLIGERPNAFDFRAGEISDSSPPIDAQPGDVWGAYILHADGWWRLNLPPQPPTSPSEIASREPSEGGSAAAAGRVVCAWCKLDMGPATTEQDTHGLCVPCAEKLLKDYERVAECEQSHIEILVGNQGCKAGRDPGSTPAALTNLPTPQCSSGTTQSRPYPTRAVKVTESAGQHAKPATRHGKHGLSEVPSPAGPDAALTYGEAGKTRCLTGTIAPLMATRPVKSRLSPTNFTTGSMEASHAGSVADGLAPSGVLSTVKPASCRSSVRPAAENNLPGAGLAEPLTGGTEVQGAAAGRTMGSIPVTGASYLTPTPKRAGSSPTATGLVVTPLCEPKGNKQRAGSLLESNFLPVPVLAERRMDYPIGEARESTQSRSLRPRLADAHTLAAGKTLGEWRNGSAACGHASGTLVPPAIKQMQASIPASPIPFTFYAPGWPVRLNSCDG